METSHSEKIANTKRLLKKLFVVGFLFATFHYLSAKTNESTVMLTKLNMSSTISAIDNSKLSVSSEELPPFILKLSINIDLGKKLSDTIHDIVGR